MDEAVAVIIVIVQMSTPHLFESNKKKVVCILCCCTLASVFCTLPKRIALEATFKPFPVGRWSESYFLLWVLVHARHFVNYTPLSALCCFENSASNVNHFRIGVKKMQLMREANFGVLMFRRVVFR